MVTVLDQYQAGVAAAAIDETTANLAIARSARQGYLDGESLAEVFAWLRPAGRPGVAVLGEQLHRGQITRIL